MSSNLSLLFVALSVDVTLHALIVSLLFSSFSPDSLSPLEIIHDNNSTRELC